VIGGARSGLFRLAPQVDGGREQWSVEGQAWGVRCGVWGVGAGCGVHPDPAENTSTKAPGFGGSRIRSAATAPTTGRASGERQALSQRGIRSCSGTEGPIPLEPELAAIIPRLLPRQTQFSEFVAIFWDDEPLD
jgi:hypothetical protein